MVDKLILGTVQFGLNYGINNLAGKPDKDTVFEILSYAYDHGISYLDTAELYGDAHNLIGEFHRLNPSKKFKVITKFPHNFETSLEDKLQSYLNQLNVDHLYAILFHSFDSYLKHKGDLSSISSRNNLKYLGVSVYTNEQMQVVINDVNVNIIQLPFNLLDNLNIKGELLIKAKEKNKIIHTRSAFLQGLFFMKRDNSNSIRTKLEKELDFIADISSKSTKSIGSIALNYCLVQPNIDGVLIGVESVQQLKENISFSKHKFSDGFFDQIDKIKIENVELLNPSKWQ